MWIAWVAKCGCVVWVRGCLDYMYIMVTQDMYWRSLRGAWLCVCSTSKRIIIFVVASRGDSGGVVRSPEAAMPWVLVEKSNMRGRDRRRSKKEKEKGNRI